MHLDTGTKRGVMVKPIMKYTNEPVKLRVRGTIGMRHVGNCE